MARRASFALVLAFVLVQCSQAQSSGQNATSNDSVDQDSSRRQYNQQLAEDEYLVGVGIADITGPAADINLMGYAKPNQDAGGIHLRQFSRSIMIEDRAGSRILYINLDNGMISQLLRSHVIGQLKRHFGATSFNESNVMLTATHTHSCPGGFFQYMLYNIPSAGFIKQTFDALSDGILRSVQRALASVQPSRIFMIKGELLDASINRSPTAYANNPPEERASYEHNTDKEMFLWRVVDRQNQPVAMVNWFAVHGTSMNNSNHLISSDNKGYAALLFERDYNLASELPGKGKFVAIFAQANEGDVSPNTQGPRCIDTGLPCDPVTSTCGSPPRNEKCIATGPGRDMFESTQMIAYKQYFKAKQLFEDTSKQQQVRGPVRHVHEHIDMTQQVVPAYESASLVLQWRESRDKRRALELGSKQQKRNVSSSSGSSEIGAPYRTCKPALGYSFAAGTTDGPGAFDFQQGDTVSTRYWNLVRDFLKRPSADSMRCHHPKPILLATGQMEFPYMWHPKVVPTQVFMVGQVALVGLPGEFTTMAGRRVREAVRRTLARQELLLVDESQQANRSFSQRPEATRREEDSTTLEVVLSGLSNIYTSYITTIEEYELQRYEAGSTLYGPHTLQAYVNQFERLAARLANNQQPPDDDSLQPPDLSKSLFTLKAGVIFDGAPRGTQFGSVLTDADTGRVYKPQELVSVSFVAGNPRNDLRQEESFLYVELFNTTGQTWTLVATDASWETKFIWERTNTLFGESRALIEWQIPTQVTTGVYRIRHVGAHKSLIMQTVANYAGRSSPFKVANGDTDQFHLESIRQFVDELQRQQQQSNSDDASIQRQASAKSDPDQQVVRAALNKRLTLVQSLLAPLRYIGNTLHLRRLFN